MPRVGCKRVFATEMEVTPCVGCKRVIARVTELRFVLDASVYSLEVIE